MHNIHVFYDHKDERAQTFSDNLIVFAKDNYNIMVHSSRGFLVKHDFLIFLTDDFLPKTGIKVSLTDELMNQVCDHAHSVLELCYDAIESGQLQQMNFNEIFI
jgi:hypothetical protein